MDPHSHIPEKPELTIDLLDILWDLLNQWKAVTIVACLLALALPGIKLLRDTKSYQASLAAIEAQNERAVLPTSEIIEQALASLSDDDVATVSILVRQQQLVDAQSAYLNDSILMNVDPSNQRTLTLTYLINADTSVTPVADTYTTQLHESALLHSLAAMIGPEAELSYIDELLTTTFTSQPDGNMTSTVYHINIVLPEGVDADATGDIIDSYINNVSSNVSNTAGTHTIEPIKRNEVYCYNEGAAQRQASLISSVNANRTALKASVAALTDDQKAAFTEITAAIREGEQKEKAAVTTGIDEKVTTDTVSEDVPEPPTFSKKFAILGFISGTVLYAIVYVISTMMRGRIGSSAALRDCTRSRLLGIVYYPKSHTGISALFHSAFVSKLRYTKFGDVSTQVIKAASTVESVCKHAKISEVHILRIGNIQSANTDITTGLVTGLVEQGIDTRVMDTSVSMDEKALLSVQNVIFLADSDSKSTDVWRTATLCQSYDISALGCIFTRGW